MKRFLLLVVMLIATVNYGFCASLLKSGSTGIGSSLKTNYKSVGNIGSYNTRSNISVIEYDTYGAESGYYVEDSFGMTTKYDKYGNVLSKYQTNQVGKTLVYDKYGNVNGYFLPVSKTKTVFYDRYGNALGYFMPDRNGFINKYDMDGNHLNTYKKP